MKIVTPILLAVFLLGTLGPVLANNPAEPNKGPPDCPGAPGAFIAEQAQDSDPQETPQETPPGKNAAQIARGSEGRGAGDKVREALNGDCGIGAFPQED